MRPAAALPIETGALATTLRYVTITNNTAGSGNALVLMQYPATMINSIIAGNVNDGVASVNGGAFSGQSNDQDPGFRWKRRSNEWTEWQPGRRESGGSARSAFWPATGERRRPLRSLPEVRPLTPEWRSQA